jgi:hypothetical protein
LDLGHSLEQRLDIPSPTGSIAIEAAIGRDKLSRTKRLIAATNKRDLVYMTSYGENFVSIMVSLEIGKGYDKKR